MTATATLQELNGAGPTVNTPAGTPQEVRFCTDDDHNPGTDHKIPIPATAGTTYSFWKTWRINFTGTFTSITNVKLYVADTFDFGTGITVKIGENTGITYTAATGDVDETGDELTNTSYTGVGTPADISGFTSASPKTIDDTTISEEGPCKIFICQLEVDETATQGVLTPETVTIQYDEV